jgi:hypothetical protein
MADPAGASLVAGTCAQPVNPDSETANKTAYSWRRQGLVAFDFIELIYDFYILG